MYCGTEEKLHCMETCTVLQQHTRNLVDIVKKYFLSCKNYQSNNLHASIQVLKMISVAEPRIKTKLFNCVQ